MMSSSGSFCSALSLSDQLNLNLIDKLQGRDKPRRKVVHFHVLPPKPTSGRPLSRRSPPLLRRAQPAMDRKEMAFPESLPLHSKNPRAIYSDVQRFARLDKLREAFAIMDYLDKQGIPVNATTFSALIAACVRTKSLTDGRQVHAFVRANGLDGNEFLRTRLVHMYTSCGSFDDARDLFDEMPSRSVYPWNALLRGSVVSGGRRYRDAVSAYREMRSLGLELNVYTFSSVVKSVAGAPAISEGMKVHALLVKNGFIGSDILRTCLVDMYCKCGKINLARKVFDEIPERDVVLWGAMIAGLAHNRLQWQALEYLRWMVDDGTRPNSAILTAILPAIGDVSAPILGRELHAYVVKTKSYAKQVFVQSALIDMYCKCGDLESGRQVFFGSDERNAICWTALMSGYVSNGRPDQALRAVAWMQQEGARPDVVTVATAIPVCTELGELNRGKEIHAYAVKNCFFPNVSIASSLMMMYSKCGVSEYPPRLFDAVEKKNVILWTAMIDSHAQTGRFSDALAVFRSMAVSKHRPDSVAIGRVLSICGEVKSLRLGKEVHGHALKKNFDSVHFVSARIVRMYGSCGAVDHAKSAFDSIGAKGSMSWTAIIEAYQSNGLYRDAMSLFDRMRDQGFIPNRYTFRVLLSVCDEAGFVDEARQFFKLMTRQYKIEPSEEHYSLIIRLLTRFGREEDAQRFVELRSSLS